MIEYTNVPKTVAAVIAAGKATLAELDTVYGVEDMWTMLEIIQVDNHNARVMQGDN
nr:transcription elongation factor GreA [Xenorhabdus hominickii]